MLGLRDYCTNNKMFVVLLSFFSLFRVYLGMNMPIWLFPTSVYDDILMFNYSHLTEHFNNWDILSLVKGMSYPVFLFFVKLSQIPYRFWLSILWIIAALLVVYAINKFLSKDKRILIFSFIFVLFLPVGFDVLCGQRVYRNAIITPTTIIFLSMLYIFINNILNYSISDNSPNIRNIAIWGILLGLTFTFNYYIKEDGILTLPIVLICIFSVLLFKIYEETKFSFLKERKFSFSDKNFENIVKISIICIIPLILFVAGTVTYQEVNYHCFGVAEINTRTSGELGDFYENLLKIKDPNKNAKVWIPPTTVQKAYNVSPTLQAHPEFINTWLDTPWGTDSIRNSTISGDIATWNIRVALKNVNMYNNEKSVDEYFDKVNQELDSAFNSGKLEKSDKIFITGTATGKDVGEIMNLTPYYLFGLETTLFYKGLEFNNVSNKISSLYTSTDMSKNASGDIHDSLITENELKNLSGIDGLPLSLIELDMSIYKIISYILVALSFIAFIWTCIHQFRNNFKNRNINMLILFNIMLIGTALVQIIAVTWFCSFITTTPWVGSLNSLLAHIKFYLVSAYGFFTMFVIFSFAGVFSIIYKKGNEKSKYRLL